ncbi:MAG: gamma-glutamyl-gamma-aminobutyrate hydrolase family protein [Solirubrobacteraceae bacterium]
MSRPPLIGVSTSEVRFPEDVDQTEHAEPPRRELAVGVTYADAVEQAGGVPVVLAPVGVEMIDPLLARLDGLCISGGPDLDPSYYGAEPHPELGPTFPDIDRFELAILRHAQARGLPVLAICRGMQLLNVSRGGTLSQHLPDRVDGSVVHRQTRPGRFATHEVRVERASRLRGLLGGERLGVNSFHHQAVERIGTGLHAVAWSPDGVIEAVETDAQHFALGGPWHAESLVDDTPHAALFTALVRAATAHRECDGAAGLASPAADVRTLGT